MRVAVVGGGISGLAAARSLADGGADVVVFEKSSRVGGALRTTPIGDVPVEEGADAFLIRVPWAADLAREVVGDLVHPATGSASLFAGGRLRDLPTGTLLGVPSSLASVRDVLSRRGFLRASLDRVLPPSRLPADPSVGKLVRRRLGAEVLDRLVDPLLGGVYAGSADGLSVAMTAPALAERQRSLLATAASKVPTPTGAPVFASAPGGIARFPEALATGLAVRFDTTVVALEPSWTLLTGAKGRESRERFDAVVLAVPAPAAAKLLAGHTTALPSTQYASVGIVTLVLPAGTETPERSGVLVAPSEGRTVKAITFVGRKWGHPADAPVVVRTSVGRFGQEADLQRSDEELVQRAARDVAEIAGVRGELVASRVSRWGGALPQYAPGHLDRVRVLRSALPQGVAVAGAAYDGVGIPACVRSGQTAAEQLLRG